MVGNEQNNIGSGVQNNSNNNVEQPFVSYGMKKQVVNFDRDYSNNNSNLNNDGNQNEKGPNFILLGICGLLIVVGIVVFPKLSDKYNEMKSNKNSQQSNDTSSVQKKDDDKPIEKLKINDSKVTNLIYPIYHIDSSVKNTYYAKDKMSINNFTNYDLQVNAMANFSSILYVTYKGAYSGKSCASKNISVDSKYFPIQVNNLYTKNVSVKQGDINIPTNNPANLYAGSWKYNAAQGLYVYYGDCNPKNANLVYYDLRYTYDVDNSEKNIELYTFNYVAFAAVDKKTRGYIIYSDPGYTKEIKRGTLTTNYYNTELNNILKNEINKDSLSKYKYTFTVKNCPYQEYCYVSGEWVK